MDDIVIRPKDIGETRALSKELAASALIPQALKKKPEDVMAVVMTGAELGLAPMQSIRGIHIINGKPSLSADTMGALVKRSSTCEYLALAESTGEVATYKTKRKGEPGETTLSFTMKQAKAAGITSNPTWSKYPDAMLRARALAAICRAVYPDLCMGLYDPDEIEPAPQPVGEDLKADLRAEIVEGEIVPLTLAERIRATESLEALQALLPELKTLSAEEREQIKPVYLAQKGMLEDRE